MERRLAEKEIALQADDRVLDLLASEGYDRSSGARPSGRLIERRNPESTRGRTPLGRIPPR